MAFGDTDRKALNEVLAWVREHPGDMGGPVEPPLPPDPGPDDDDDDDGEGLPLHLRAKLTPRELAGTFQVLTEGAPELRSRVYSPGEWPPAEAGLEAHPIWDAAIWTGKNSPVRRRDADPGTYSIIGRNLEVEPGLYRSFNLWVDFWLRENEPTDDARYYLLWAGPNSSAGFNPNEGLAVVSLRDRFGLKLSTGDRVTRRQKTARAKWQHGHPYRLRVFWGGPQREARAIVTDGVTGAAVNNTIILSTDLKTFTVTNRGFSICLGMNHGGEKDGRHAKAMFQNVSASFVKD